MSKLKKILHITGYLALTGMLGAYFYFASLLVRENTQDRCQDIVITIRDSVHNPLTGAGDVALFLENRGMKMLGRVFSEIDMYRLEKDVESFASVRQCNAVRTIDGTLRLEIEQHMPLFRLDTHSGSFFITGERYMFPLVSPYRMPVLTVSAHVPLSYPASYRGLIDSSDTWLTEMSRMMAYISAHPFWKNRIRKIQAKDPEEIHIIPHEEEPLLMIGSLDNFSYKMNKLLEFYRVLEPLGGKGKYSQVDARFGEQLVCKRKK
ncbi:MAG: hypothetical protein WC377_03840 [Bacteroidales bacterium]|jgi:cell division protein FtsQ|nr:hypothetical protein [Bacteroidales bacterium]MDD2824035.1 hypothetical protein [Bacteroidales bacterium]MDD3100210.1 hypothetical protein [Bacteroidales bacterium]MDD3638861.1 hypothetical protein [Bacteroidales bacterium]MDD3943162.1 hypothetical protein [Bacteroidales bacterium]